MLLLRLLEGLSEIAEESQWFVHFFTLNKFGIFTDTDSSQDIRNCHMFKSCRPCCEILRAPNNHLFIASPTPISSAHLSIYAVCRRRPAKTMSSAYLN